MKSITALGLLLISAAAPAAELHPIVELQSGYLFGATADGKWIKAEEAAKALTDETTYRIYGLTQPFGEAKGGKPKSTEEDVCSDMFVVSLSPKPEKRDRTGRTVECVAAKATNDRSDTKSLRRCCARFFENERNRATESEDR